MRDLRLLIWLEDGVMSCEIYREFRLRELAFVKMRIWLEDWIKMQKT